jgi:hypothetical protein
MKTWGMHVWIWLFLNPSQPGGAVCFALQPLCRWGKGPSYQMDRRFGEAHNWHNVEKEENTSLPELELWFLYYTARNPLLYQPKPWYIWYWSAYCCLASRWHFPLFAGPRVFKRTQRTGDYRAHIGVWTRKPINEHEEWRLLGCYDVWLL